MTIRVAAVLAAVLVMLLVPGRAAAQSGVQELWKEYPLQQQEENGAHSDTTPDRAARGRARAARDGGGTPVLPLVGAVVALSVVASGALLVARRRDTAPAPRPVPIHHEDPHETLAWAAGETVMGEPGPFAGPVEYDGAEMVLVRDKRRGAVWVWRSDIRRSNVVQRPRART